MPFIINDVKRMGRPVTSNILLIRHMINVITDIRCCARWRSTPMLRDLPTDVCVFHPSVKGKAVLTHGLTWAEAPGPQAIRGPITSCRIKTRRERGTDSPPPNTCRLIWQHGYDVET